ncbi:MAG: hypothetical protein RLZZ15_253 [Verrucomicrobiota bacterium]|jgi:RNA polymerase sigma-70 factor (ECF subfamily)
MPPPDQSPWPVPSQTRWFAEEVQPHAASLRGYLRGAFPAVRDVEDVVQESCLRVWKAHADQPIASVRAFLFRVARNVALDLVRRDRRSPITAAGDLAALRVVDERTSVAERLGTAEQVETLAAALDALPRQCREVMIFCKLDGHTYAEAAAHFGLSEKTVAEHLYRGMQRLGEELHRRGLHRFDP